MIRCARIREKNIYLEMATLENNNDKNVFEDRESIHILNNWHGGLTNLINVAFLQKWLFHFVHGL